MQSSYARFAFYFSLSALLAFGFVIAQDDFKMRGAFAFGGYYMILILFSAWIYSIVRILKTEKIPVTIWLKTNSKHFLGIFFLCVSIFSSVPPKLRVLNDETNLLSVAQSMATDRTALISMSSSVFYGAQQFIERSIPSRPLGFPFLVSIIHTLFGIHYQNAYLLNFVLLFALLVFAFSVFKQSFDSASGWAACFFLLSTPVITLAATSAGYDLGALVFLLLSLYSLYLFMKAPSKTRLALLWTTSLFLSHIRYETALFFPLVFGGLLFLKYLKWREVEAWIPLTLVSFLLVAWQRYLMRDAFENPPAVAAFGFSHLLKHIPVFIKTQFDLRFDLPYPTLLHLISWYLIFWMIIFFFRKKANAFETFQKHFAALSGILFISLLAVYLSHHLGLANSPTQTRLFLGAASILSLSPLIFKKVIPQKIPSVWILVLALLSFLLYHPVSIQNRFMNSLTGTQETQYILRFFENKTSKDFVVIHQSAPQLIALGIASVPFDHARRNETELKKSLKDRFLDKIFIIQHLNTTGLKPDPEEALGVNWDTRPIEEFWLTPAVLLRISELIVKPS